jgi:Transposase DDE domain group 1
VLVRTDAAGATHEFLNCLASQRLSYSVGFTLPDSFAATLALIPDRAWTPAYDADGEIRDGAWVAELADLLDLRCWPKDMRVIVRKERPHPGAQLRLTDVDGHRITAVATNTARGQLADLELRHRRRARCEDRIRNAKDTGLTNLPLHEFTQNQIWCAIVALACELIAWMQMLALTRHQARAGNPNAYGYACSPSPDVSPTTAAPDACTYPHTHPGPNYSREMITRLQTLPAPG